MVRLLSVLGCILRERRMEDGQGEFHFGYKCFLQPDIEEIRAIAYAFQVM